MQTHDIAILPGDGVGPEVTAEARKVVEAAGRVYGFAVAWREFPFGAEYYLAHGHALPASALAELADYDALLLGAIGDPRVKPGPLEQEILLALRFHFDQYVNLRPAFSFPGVPLPVALPPGRCIDAIVVRENTEDLYMGLGGSGQGAFSVPVSATRKLYDFKGSLGVEFPSGLEAGISIGMMTRPAVERIARYAFALARERGETTLRVVTKANAVPHLYGFWDKVVLETATEFPDIACALVNVDAACYLLARDPGAWGVLLCPNLFGDIVSDLLSGLSGGLGLAAAGNIGEQLSMFEPVHGSAPDIAGSGRANPLAAILSAVLMLRHLGRKEAADAVERAVRGYLASDDPKPIEQGGAAVTSQVGDRIRERVESEG